MKSRGLPPLLAVRVDGGRRLGMGHLKKQAILVPALKRRVKGLRVLFLVRRDAGAVRWLQARGHTVIRMPEKLPLKKEPEWMLRHLPGERSTVMVIDILEVPADYIRKLKASPRIKAVALFESRGSASQAADAAINAIVDGPAPANKRTGGGRFYGGAGYRVFHPAYKGLGRRRKRSHEAVVTFGGGEDKGLSMAAAAALAQTFPELRVTLIQGAAQAGPGRSSHRNIRIVRDAESLAPYLRRACAALTAGGGTLYELALCGVPAVAFAKVPHQRRNIRWFAESGTVADGGAFSEREIARGIVTLAGLLSDARQFKKMAQAGRRLVDGRGTERVLKIIQRLLEMKSKEKIK